MVSRFFFFWKVTQNRKSRYVFIFYGEWKWQGGKLCKRSQDYHCKPPQSRQEIPIGFFFLKLGKLILSATTVPLAGATRRVLRAQLVRGVVAKFPLSVRIARGRQPILTKCLYQLVTKVFFQLKA